MTDRPHKQRATIEEIVTAYRATGSVWKAGKRLGLAGQSVHERLRAIDYPLGGRQWSSDEEQELAALLTASVTLGEAARRLGRTFNAVACKASELELRVKHSPAPKLPRGAGYDKASVRRHVTALEAFAGSFTQYARAHGLPVETLAQACQRHFPDWWINYVASRSDLPSKSCEYCERVYIPSNGKQQFCTRKCAADARNDRDYFGGRRRETLGLAEGVCQLCGREQHKGLSSHHAIGKEHDPDNASLIALCAGCHKLVEMAAARKFVNDEAAWETLIQLAWLRHHGGRMPEDHDTLHVTLDIQTYKDAEAMTVRS